jgi:perosamine synthetase
LEKTEAIPFYVPWINREDKKAVFDALKSRWLTGGPQTAHFEESFADYVGAKYAIAVNSCTAALHLAMRVLNIKPGDEAIVPVLTFAATANAPIFCGAKPVFADIDEKTFCISPDDIAKKITSRTRVIIPVHYGGQSCDMKEILKIAEDHNLFVVEDCAHSLGSEYKGKKTGNFGDMGCFSFYPTKIITTIEGGMVTTDNEEYAKKLKLLREHGMSRTALDRETSNTWYYDVVDVGYNYRLTEPQAALGLSQLKRIDEGIRRRINAAKYYTKQLSKHASNVTPPYEAPDRSHIHHLYTVKIKKVDGRTRRNEVHKKLSESGIQSSVHYTPLHLLSFYKQFLNKHQHTFPVAEKIYDEILSLPIYPTLTRENVNAVTTRIEESLCSDR